LNPLQCSHSKRQEQAPKLHIKTGADKSYANDASAPVPIQNCRSVIWQKDCSAETEPNITQPAWPLRRRVCYSVSRRYGQLFPFSPHRYQAGP